LGQEDSPAHKKIWANGLASGINVIDHSFGDFDQFSPKDLLENHCTAYVLGTYCYF
jgi:hypothetical protein